MRYLFLILGLIISNFCFSANSEISDTLIYNSAEQIEVTKPIQNEEYVDVVPPEQLFAFTLFFGFFLISVGAGIVLTIVALSIIFFLVSFGVLSASIIVGLNKKSFEKGFKTFILISSSIGGSALGVITFVFQNYMQCGWSTEFPIISGLICGLISGLLFGLLMYYVIKRLSTYFITKLKV